MSEETVLAETPFRLRARVYACEISSSPTTMISCSDQRARTAESSDPMRSPDNLDKASTGDGPLSNDADLIEKSSWLIELPLEIPSLMARSNAFASHPLSDTECRRTDFFRKRSKSSPVMKVENLVTFPALICTHFVCVPGKHTTPSNSGRSSKIPAI